MRCRSCDRNLSDQESTRKSAVTEEYIDLCNYCFTTVEEYFTSQEENTPLEEFLEENYDL